MPARTSFSWPCTGHGTRLLVLCGITLAAMTAASAQVATCDNAQDRATCQREARNAQADRRHGGLTTPADPQANALARCSPLQGEDKSACEARVMGYGSSSGSVSGGGLLREAETVVMPPGATEITVQPRGGRPVVVLPSPER